MLGALPFGCWRCHRDLAGAPPETRRPDGTGGAGRGHRGVDGGGRLLLRRLTRSASAFHRGQALFGRGLVCPAAVVRVLRRVGYINAIALLLGWRRFVLVLSPRRRCPSPRSAACGSSRRDHAGVSRARRRQHIDGLRFRVLRRPGRAAERAAAAHHRRTGRGQQPAGAALAENATLHEQLLAQARDAGIAEERRRMAREIHDTLAQGLAGIVTQLEAVGDGCPADTARRLELARGLARESLVEARRSVSAMQPAGLIGARLSEALDRARIRVAATQRRAGRGARHRRGRSPLPAGRRTGAVPGRPGGAHQRRQACRRRPGGDHPVLPRHRGHCSTSSTTEQVSIRTWPRCGQMRPAVSGCRRCASGSRRCAAACRSSRRRTARRSAWCCRWDRSAPCAAEPAVPSAPTGAAIVGSRSARGWTS